MSENSDKPGGGGKPASGISKPAGAGSTPGGGFKFEQWHDVVKGDTLSKIAEKYYGDPSLYTKIFEANRNILKDPNLIKIGQKLRIP